MAVDKYEKYVGYKTEELNYKNEVVVDKVSGNEVEKRVKRTPEEIEEYKRQKNVEFDGMVATWERLGIKSCAWERAFDGKKFDKIYINLIKNRLNELSNNNQGLDIESNMVNAVNDVYKKYNIGPALKFYSVTDDGYTSTSRIFNGVRKSEIEKMFYKNISMEKAGMLARNRLSKATTLNEGVALLQELQKTHNSRSFFSKLFHPFKNAEENRLIREMKSNVMQKFNVSENKLNSKLKTQINTSNLKTANLYKINEFVDMYSHETSGKLYSQNVIDNDRSNAERRADD